jgi:hypothetical protein
MARGDRCATCGRRWCACIPPGASVDYFTALPPAPMQGPDRRGLDANAEILEIAADIYWGMSPSEWLDHIRALAKDYTPAQLAEALVMAMERVP